MVKKILLIPVLLFICVTIGCTLDLLGLFVSNDLAERLKDKDNFVLLKEKDLAPPSFGDEYSFIVIADTHIELSYYPNIDPHKLFTLNDLIEEYNNNNKNIKFAIILGDITQYGSETDIKNFTDIAQSLSVPCYPVIGNHDIYFGNWSVWKKHIGSTRYKIDGGTASLFILDSANAFFGKDQLDWLETEINKTQGRVFVFTHSNLFVDGAVNIQQLSDTAERARIMNILHKKCDVMFMGHSHKRVIEESGGVKYISVEDFVTTGIYCLVTVTKTGISYAFESF